MSDPFGIYCHIPFCRAKCAYCDFNTYVGLDHLKEAYVRALIDDIKRTTTATGLAGGQAEVGPATTLFFGGGTPSLLTPSQLERTIDACRRDLGLRLDAETTIEANPFGLDETYLAAILEAGVNRISLGVQSFDDDLLKKMGRLHTADQAALGHQLVRRAGFDNVNLDLIYGYPEQTLDQWKSSLVRAIDLGPTHLSLYALTVEEGTALASQIERGHQSLPDPDLAADMYLWACEQLALAGYDHYEISNWALPGRACQHNLIYWRNQPYLGFGAGAHSAFGGKRFWTVRLPGEYIKRVSENSTTVEDEELIDLRLAMAETMILGLRLDEGIDPARFASRFSVDPRLAYQPVLEDLTSVELITVGDTIRLTERGKLLGNQVFMRFLTA